MAEIDGVKADIVTRRPTDDVDIRRMLDGFFEKGARP
jgi:hypothetical protein